MTKSKRKVNEAVNCEQLNNEFLEKLMAMVAEPSFASSYTEAHHRWSEGMKHASEIEEKCEY